MTIYTETRVQTVGMKRPALILLLLAIFLPLVLSACSRQEDVAQEAEQTAEKVIPVTVEVVAPRDLSETFILPATLEAKEDLSLAAELSGPLEKLHVKEGQRVSKGDLLLEIDAKTVRSQLRSDEENAAVLKSKLERYRKLVAEGLVSRQQVDELQNAWTAADSALTSRKLLLDKSLVRAPAAGLIDRIDVDPGEYIDVGKPLLRLVALDQLKVNSEVPEKDVAYLSVGQSVEVIPARIGQADPAPLTGRIDFIAYAATQQTRTYRTQVVLDNPGGLRPGMIVRCRFVRQQRPAAISVPLYALIDQAGSKSVFIDDNGIARRLPVRLGSAIGTRVIISSGLQAGQRLIVRGQQLLVDGAAVRAGD